LIHWLLSACAREPAIEASDARNVVVVLAEGLEQGGARVGAMPIQGRMLPAVRDPARDQEAWLTGMWPTSMLGASSGSTPNVLPQVLALYGYRTVALAGPGAFAGGAGSRFDRVERATEERCPDAWIADAEKAFQARAAPTLVVVDTSVRACADWDASLGALLDALAPVLGEALVVVEPSPGSEGPLALSMRTAEPRRVLAQTTDVLPTVLGFARAVVPSDAQGTPLQSPEVGEGRPTFTLESGSLVVHGGPAEVRIDKPAEGWPQVLPEKPTAETKAVREGAPVALDDPEVLRLWPIVKAWYDRMRATDARSRMGNAAFEQMLRDQGYW
jgi:hypothetical protein